MDEGRRGGWIQTFSGVRFWPMDPRGEEMVIGDIAHSLSFCCVGSMVTAGASIRLRSIRSTPPGWWGRFLARFREIFPALVPVGR